MIRRAFLLVVAALALSPPSAHAQSAPARARLGMVITESDIASEVGFQVIKGGGNAIDAAVATAFAMAVTHPAAGNIGGGGLLVYRPESGEPTSYDFRERAPAGSSAEMWLKDGKYDSDLHHYSHRAVGVPGTVSGLHLAWKEHGSKPWKDLLTPGDRAGPGRLPYLARPRPVARGDDPGVQEIPGVAGSVLKERRALPGGRHPQAGRPGPHA